MKRQIKGSVSIEAAIIVPLILWMFMLVVFILFYYHDKNVVSAMLHETTVMASEAEDVSIEDIEDYFQKRIRGKLLLFPQIDMQIQLEEESIYVVGIGRKRGMRLRVEMRMSITEPEKTIRNIRRIGAIE